MSPPPGLYMDCNTCDTAPAVVINKPDVIDVNLSITEKAKEMLRFLSGKSHQVITSVGFLTHNKFDIISYVLDIKYHI